VPKNNFLNYAMTRVDFYVLADDKINRDRFACMLTARAASQGLNIHIHTDTRDSALNIDDLMWTFRDISFIPHCLVDEAPQYNVPVNIGWNGTSPCTDDVLINLDTGIPEFAGSFTRIMEVVVPDKDSREQSRKRYRTYRDMGFDLHSHEMESDYANI